MSELSTLKSQVYSDVSVAISSYVTDTDAHVIREDDNEPDSPPMVALSGTDRQRAGGNAQSSLHDLRVLNISHDPFDVEYGRERTFSVDVTITDIDGNRADSILKDIMNAFQYDPRFRDPCDFVDGVIVDAIRVQDTSPTSRDQRIGHALAIEIDFVRTFQYSDVDSPPVEVEKVVQEYENGKTIETTASGTTVTE